MQNDEIMNIELEKGSYSFGMWHCITRWLAKNSSPNISTLEEETNMQSQNVRNHSPSDAAPKPRRGLQLYCYQSLKIRLSLEEHGWKVLLVA